MIYRGADDHIHELHWKSGREGPDWRHNDLTEATDPDAPLAAGDPTGYAFEEDESQHVVYRGADNHIHELHWKGAETSWIDDVFSVIRAVFTGVVDAITTIFNFLIEILDSTLGWIVSLLGFFVELAFSIPILGRVLKWLWNLGLTGSWAVAPLGAVDFLAALLGILPEKKLRICVIILRDEMGEPIETPANLVRPLQNTIDIFRREANVRVIPSAPLQFDSGFGSPERATEEWVHTQARGRNDSSVLDVACGAGAASEDLGAVGGQFELLASTNCFYSNARRVVGYGAPVVVFIVRSVGGIDDGGCSIGPLSDYVTVEASPGDTVIAHELGHACSLWHVKDRTNLMARSRTDTRLDRGQVAMLRSSRHVSYS